MAYTQYQDSKPVISDSGGAVIDAVRDNLLALRDSIVTGALVGWDMTASGSGVGDGTPSQIEWRKDGALIYAGITWSQGNPTRIDYKHQASGSSTIEDIGTLTIIYSNDGNVTGSVWS